MVFMVFSRDSWGLQPINTHYIGLISGFPIRVRWDRGTSNYPPNLCFFNQQRHAHPIADPDGILTTSIFWGARNLHLFFSMGEKT